MPSDDIHTALAPVPAFTNKNPIHFSSTHAVGRLFEDRKVAGGGWVVGVFIAFVSVLVGDGGSCFCYLPFGTLHFSFARFFLVSLLLLLLVESNSF